jgi:hypothetical protein
MDPVLLKDGIYWVGAVDWDLQYFHGPSYSTHRGTTYNSYLVVDEKITLVDTVYAPFAGAPLSVHTAGAKARSKGSKNACRRPAWTWSRRAWKCSGFPMRKRGNAAWNGAVLWQIRSRNSQIQERRVCAPQ